MKVRDLLEILSTMDPETEVILQKDAEGNGYSPLYSVYPGIYVAITTWYGEVSDPDWSADDACLSPEEWKAIKHRPRCVVLRPVN